MVFPPPFSQIPISGAGDMWYFKNSFLVYTNDDESSFSREIDNINKMNTESQIVILKIKKEN